MDMSKITNTNTLDQEPTLDSMIEGIIYLISEPITLTRLSLTTQSNIEQIQDAVRRLQTKYEQMKDPFIIKQTLNENSSLNTVELKLHDEALRKLQKYAFTSSQELPKKFFQIMSIIMHLEYVKNIQINKKILKKELKIDQKILDKNLEMLIHFGYLEQKQEQYRTSDRFLRRMGFPTDKERVKIMLKEKTIEYALQYFGFENEK